MTADRKAANWLILVERPDMADSNSIAEPQDEDRLSVFRHVRAALNLEVLPDYASRLRQKNLPQVDQTSPITDCKVDSEPLFGSYHILFRISFSDGACWILKVPANGYKDAFDKLSARALRTEALTMRLIKEKTTVPIPAIYEFSDACDNPLGCPFILMEYIDGRPLQDAWFERDIAPDVLERHREHALQDLANALVQLNTFTSRQAGALTFGPDEKPCSDVGPFREVDISTMLDRLREEEDYDGSSVYYELGPISDPVAYFTHTLNRREPPTDEFGMGMHKLLRLFIDWAVSESEAAEASPDEPTFVLAHPDLDIQNVLVSKTNGRLLGLIDWDGVITKPQCMFGNECYPSWLTRDWDSMKYRNPEDTPVEETSANASDDDAASDTSTIKENTPKELALYREKWQTIITAASTNPSAKKLAHNSLVVHNLKIAADDPMCEDHIVEKIFEEAKEKTLEQSTRNGTRSEEKDKDNVEEDEDEDVDDFYLYEVCTKLATGQLEDEQHQRLEKGFRALFWHETESA
ncbi:kinase-like domain-containing protein [Aspergillus unguis]